MQQLTVESVGPSKSGKALRVKAGGKWYGAKKDSGIQAGQTIEAEVSDGEFGLWIDKWKPANGSAAPQGGALTESPASRNGGNPAVAAPWWANFMSNVVGQAIAAKAIDDPHQIKIWALAAKEAAQEAMK